MQKFKIQKNKGMSYVELIVVLGIFTTLSSVAMFNYGDFQDRVDIKNLGSDIALKIVEAQKSSIDGKWNSNVALLDWKPSYGVYFDTRTTIDPLDNVYFNKKFIYFTDLNNTDFYDGLSSCTTAECLDKINITKNNYISEIKVFFTDSTTSILNSLNIFFKRPDSSAIFSNSSGVLFANVDYIQITVKSPKSAIVLIKIYPSGRVQVN